MPQESPTYDLMLLLSTEVEEERRAKILQDVEGTIESANGSIVHNADWGARPLTFRIQHQSEAQYHLLQFTGPTSLLESLGHNLGITDGVLRHRIIKVLPGTPPPPAPERVAVAASHAPAPEPATATVEQERDQVTEAAAPVQPAAGGADEAQGEPTAGGRAEPTTGGAPGADFEAPTGGAADNAALSEDADE